MKHGSNQRRGRSRGGNGGKRHQSSRNQTLDSNGPEGKVRGSAQQIYDKYSSLARDAASAGEHISAEGFYQFAEHYYRLANVDGANNQNQNRQQQGNQQSEAEHPAEVKQNDTGEAVQVEKADIANEAETSPDVPSGGQPKRKRNPRKPAVTSGADNALVVDSKSKTEAVSIDVVDTADEEVQDNVEKPSDDKELAASA